MLNNKYVQYGLLAIAAYLLYQKYQVSQETKKDVNKAALASATPELKKLLGVS